MTDTILLIGILIAWVVALSLMPKFPKKQTSTKLRPVATEENEPYDPAQDPAKIMRGEGESYFDS
jgi:hypothetical protein